MLKLLLNEEAIRVCSQETWKKEFPGGLVVRIQVRSLPRPRFNPWSGTGIPSSCLTWPKFRRKKYQRCLSRDFTGGPVVKNPIATWGMEVPSLVVELRSHMPNHNKRPHMMLKDLA